MRLFVTPKTNPERKELLTSLIVSKEVVDLEGLWTWLNVKKRSLTSKRVVDLAKGKPKGWVRKGIFTSLKEKGSGKSCSPYFIFYRRKLKWHRDQRPLRMRVKLNRLNLFLFSPPAKSARIIALLGAFASLDFESPYEVYSVS